MRDVRTLVRQTLDQGVEGKVKEEARVWDADEVDNEEEGEHHRVKHRVVHLPDRGRRV